ncbi:hypothetical protein [Nonomuraea typhae]|uniref:Outer membrane channel protein CpnT-like N-terminal domain-containing protein n=1 Tax=Nonomuraea typhae TaxID=2603600 RepID=A0ABW7Z3Y2_9ACTN
MAGGRNNSTEIRTRPDEGFDGGIATTDVEPAWETTALPGWVVYYLIPLLTAGQSWPKASEAKLWQLRVSYVELMNELVSTLDPTSKAITKVSDGLDSPAKPAIFKRLAELYGKNGVVGNAEKAFQYAQQTDYFARETQYSKLSINVAFWVTVAAAFVALVMAGFNPLARFLLTAIGRAGAARIAIILQRLAAAARVPGAAGLLGRVTSLSGVSAGNRFLTPMLVAELFEEITEEVFIDVMAQWQQLKMGTRDKLDWDKIKAAAIGAGVGAVVGTRMAPHLSRFVNGWSPIGRLTRTAGDDPGVGNAFRRFPGRALSMGLNNMIASPVGGIAANAVVYGNVDLTTIGDQLAGGFASGIGRYGMTSPFNSSVVGAAFTPFSTLSNAVNTAFDSAFGTTGGPYNPGGPTGPGDGSGPRPGAPDSGPGGGTGPTGTIPAPRAPSDPGVPSGQARRDPAPVAPDSDPSAARRTPPAVPQPDGNPRTGPAPGQDDQAAQDPQQDDQADPQQDDEAAPAARPANAQDNNAPQGTSPDQAGVPDPTTEGDQTATPDQTTEGDQTATPDQTTEGDQTATPDQAPNRDQPGTQQQDTAQQQDVPRQQDPTQEQAPAENPTSTGDQHPSGSQTTQTDQNVSPSTDTTTTTAQADVAPQAAAASSPAVQQDAQQAPGPVARLIQRLTHSTSSRGEVSGRPIPRTRFVADGRAATLPDLTVTEAKAALNGEVAPGDVVPGATSWAWHGNTLIVETAAFGPQHFRFEVGRVRGRRLGRTKVNTGTAQDPHLVRLAPRVAPQEVGRLVLHELADTLHHRAHPSQGPVRRLLNRRSERDECLTGRLSEYRLLTRQLREAAPAERPRIRAELNALRRILRAQGVLDTRPAARPQPAPQELLERLRTRDAAVSTTADALAQALDTQVNALTAAEAEIRGRIGTRPPTPGELAALHTASRARAAYEQARGQLATATDPGVTAFATALHDANLLYGRYVRAAGPAPATALTGTSPVQLTAHIATLTSTAAGLRRAAERTTAAPDAAAARRSAADAAESAASAYRLLVDGQGTMAPEAAAQALRLGRTFEQHYRQAEALAPGATAALVDQLHTRLQEQARQRSDAANELDAAMKEQVSALEASARARREAAREYYAASVAASQRAAAALAGGDVDAARSHRMSARSLAAHAQAHLAARDLALSAGRRHELVSSLLQTMVAQGAFDADALARRVQYAEARLAEFRQAAGNLPPDAPPAVARPPAPSGPVERLRAQTREQVERLTRDKEHCAALAGVYDEQAKEARKEREEATKKIAKADQDQDASKESRKRQAERAILQADDAIAVATRRAETYRQAVTAAEEAIRAADAVVAALDGFATAGNPSATLLQARTELDELSTKFAEAFKATEPAQQARTQMFLAGPVAGVGPLTRAVDMLLEEMGSTRRYTTEEMTRLIRQTFRRVVSPDGVVLRINAGNGLELRLKLALNGFREVADPKTKHSQTISGHLPQGGGSVANTSKISRDVGGSMNPGWFIAPFVVLEGATGRSSNVSVTNSAGEFALSGGVIDDRGNAAMFEADAQWTVQVRATDGSVRQTLLLDVAEDERQRQRIWVSHAYLESRPRNLVQLEPASERGKTPFPECPTTGLTNMPDMADAVTRVLHANGLADALSREQILTMMTEDLPSCYRQAIVDPAGLSRPVMVNGRLRAIVTVNPRPVGEMTPVGTVSARHRLERLRVAFTQSSLSHSSGSGARLGGSGGLSLDPADSGLPEVAEGLRATGGYTYSWGRSRSSSAGSTAIHPSAMPFAGDTQAYVGEFTNDITIHIPGKGPITLPPMTSTGLFRVPLWAAYQHGWAVDADAVAGLLPSGEAIPRSAPATTPPEGKQDKPSPVLGSGEGLLRGAGAAAVQNLTGMAEMRAQAEAELRRMGLLPEIRNGVKRYSRDHRTMVSQYANEQLISEHLSAMRVETGYDQAAQEGIFVTLTRERTGRTTEFYTMRIKLDQRWNEYEFVEMSHDEALVTLEIASDSTSTSTSRSSTRKVPLALGRREKEEEGYALASGGAGYNRSRSTENTRSKTLMRNDVTLAEAPESATGRVPHTGRIDLLSGDGKVKNLVKDVEGTADVSLPVGMLADTRPSPSPQFTTTPAMLRRGMVTHLDTGDPAQAIMRLLGGRVSYDSVQFHELAAFFGVRNLVAHPDVFTPHGIRTGFDTQPSMEEPTHVPVRMRLQPGPSAFVGEIEEVNGDINLTLNAHGYKRSVSRRQGGEAALGLQLPGTPGGEGKMSGGGGITTSRETKEVYGPERLRIDVGKQYRFKMTTTGTISARLDGAWKTADLPEGAVLYDLPERDALDMYADGQLGLPLDQLADAAERLVNGNLKLTERIAVRFMARYLSEAEAAGNPRHTLEQANEALIKIFPARTLPALIQPGADPQAANETVANLRRRILQESDPQALLRRMLTEAHRLHDGEVSGDVAPHYVHAIGMSTIRDVTLHSEQNPGRETDVFTELLDMFDTMSPGMLDMDSELWRALAGEYSLTTWTGKIDNMQDHESAPADFTMRIGNQEELYELTIRSELDEHLEYRGEIHDHGQILQTYTMLEEVFTQVKSLTGSPSVKGGQPSGDATGSTDRGGSTSGTSAAQETRIQRAALFKDAEGDVRQGIRLTVELRRVTRNFPGPEVVTRHLTGTVDRVIPAGMYAPEATMPPPAELPADPRPTPVSDGFVTEAATAPGLADAIVSRAEELLKRKLTREERHEIRDKVTGNGLNCLFQRMTDEQGFRIVRLRLNGKQEIHVRVRAKTALRSVIAEGTSGYEEGRVDRKEKKSGVSSEQTQVTPIAGTFGVPLGPVANAAVSMRDQSGDRSSSGSGNRDETTVAEKADGSHLQYRVDYDAVYEIVDVTDDADTTPRSRVVQQNVVTGAAHLIQFDHDVAAAQAEAEARPTAPPPLRQPVAGPLMPPMSLSGLYADTGAADHTGLLDTLRRRGGPIHLAGDLAARPYGQITQARLLARDLGADVWITVPGRGGLAHVYIATPDGALHGQGAHDRSFTDRFATVPPELVDLADRSGIDLRALHERTRTQRPTLADQLRQELARQAVPLPARPKAPWPVATVPDDSTWTGAYTSGTVTGRPLPGTEFVANARDEALPDLDLDEIKAAVDDIAQRDFGGAVTTWAWSSGDTLRVIMSNGAEHHFRFEVKPLEPAIPSDRLGRTRVTAGTVDDPHQVRLTPRPSQKAVARLVIHEISDTFQHLAAPHGHTHAHPAEDGSRDECRTARENEHRYLSRKLAEATTADEHRRLQAEIDAVRRDLQERLGTPPPPDDFDRLLNWGTHPDELTEMGVVGRPERLGEHTAKVRLKDGSTAVLVELGTAQTRDLHVALAALGTGLGLHLPRVRPAGERHLLVDWVGGAPVTDPMAVSPRDTVLMAYFDSLAGIHDRATHVRVDARGRLTPLPRFATMRLPDVTNAPTRMFHRRGASGAAAWQANPLTPGDVTFLGDILAAYEGVFERIGETTVYRTMVDRHHMIAPHATGTTGVLTAAPGQDLPMADVEELEVVDDAMRALEDTGEPIQARKAVDPVAHLAANVSRDVVAERTGPLGRIVTLADGSEALALPLAQAGAVLERAWVRHVLGLPGPAIYPAPDGDVYQAVGSDLLRRSAETGIRRFVPAPAHVQAPRAASMDLVQFNDGRWAIRHAYADAATADAAEADLETLHAARDGEPGFFRAGPVTLYEHRSTPGRVTEEMVAPLAGRALYFALTGQVSAALHPWLLIENPTLDWFGQNTNGLFFVPGAPIVSAADLETITRRLAEIRGNFEWAGIIDRHDRLASALEGFRAAPGAETVPLGAFATPAAYDHSAPAWRPPEPGAPLLPGLLQGDHLRRLSAEPDPELIARADAELAAMPADVGPVHAWVPADRLPGWIQPGSVVTFNGLLEGVRDPAFSGQQPHSVRLAVFGEHVPVSEVSGKPYHAVFRPGARFRVLATEALATGERRCHLVQLGVGAAVAAPAPGAAEADAHLRDAVILTPGGIRLRAEPDAAEQHPSPPRIDGAFRLEARFQDGQFLVDGRAVDAADVAALLRQAAVLGRDDVILMGGPFMGGLAQELADRTGNIVLAGDGSLPIASPGDLRVDDEGGARARPPSGSEGGLSAYLTRGDEGRLPAHSLRGDEGGLRAYPPRGDEGGLRAYPPRGDEGGLRAYLPRGGATQAAVARLGQWTRSGPPPMPALNPGQRELMLRHRQEVDAGIWLRESGGAVAPTADPRLLRRTSGLVDVVVTGDGQGRFLIGPESVSVTDLGRMLAADPRLRAEPGAALRILGGAAIDRAALQRLADLTGREVLATDQIVFVGADRRPHAASAVEYAADGRPVFRELPLGAWRSTFPQVTIAPQRAPVTDVAGSPPPPRPALSPELLAAGAAADGGWETLHRGSDGVTRVLKDAGGQPILAMKTFTTENLAAAEVLAAAIGRAIGAGVPDVRPHPGRPDTVFMEYVPGPRPARGHQDAALLELLDLLAPQDVDHLADVLRNFRPAFEARQLTAAYEAMMDRLYQIGPRATGRVRHHFGPGEAGR